MSDLVKRLWKASKTRDTVNWCDLHAEAAAEIESLEKVFNAAVKWMDAPHNTQAGIAAETRLIDAVCVLLRKREKDE